MASNTFRVGSVKVSGNAVGKLQDASFTLDRALESDVSIGETDDTSVELLRSWSATMTCKRETTNTAQKILISKYFSSSTCLITSLYMYETGSTTTYYYSGSAFLTGLSITRRSPSIDIMSATFKGNGSLAKH